MDDSEEIPKELPNWLPKVIAAYLEEKEILGRNIKIWQKSYSVFTDQNDFEEMWSSLTAKYSSNSVLGFVDKILLLQNYPRIAKKPFIGSQKLKKLQKLYRDLQKNRAVYENEVIPSLDYDDMETDSGDAWNEIMFRVEQEIRALEEFKEYPSYYAKKLLEQNDDKAIDYQLTDTEIEFLSQLEIARAFQSRKKRSSNADAIISLRILSHYSRSYFNKPHSDYIASIVNKLYGTEYSPEEVNTYYKTAFSS